MPPAIPAYSALIASAINLYLKNGFTRLDRIYEEQFDDDFVLREYGFEIEI
jgi:hypothetical protein